MKRKVKAAETGLGSSASTRVQRVRLTTESTW
jgi:hypothetical protein